MMKFYRPLRDGFERHFPRSYYVLRTLWLHLRHERAIGVVDGLVFDNAKTYESFFKDASKEFEATVAPYQSEFTWLSGRVYNGRFSSIDIEYFYSKIREVKPRRMIEVGSGHSTRFALDAIKKNGSSHPTQFTSIDPNPRRRLPSEVRHFQKKIEEVDLSVFRELQAGDILSIDSSHMRDEVQYHLDAVLPILPKDVVIHYHDIMYPYVYLNPEEPMLFDFYRARPDQYRVLTGTSFVRYYDPQLVKRLVPSASWSEKVPSAIPSSLWAIKIG